MSDQGAVHLDQSSTSQKSAANFACATPPESPVCSYGAPLIVVPPEEGSGRSYAVIQGNCHHWDCPRCGVRMAKKHYGRMVEGSRKLASAGKSLYFVTWTCLGRGLSRTDAEENYLLWTNRLQSALRANAKKREVFWCYAAVTERQKRGHPHTHLLTTYLPEDTTIVERYRYRSRVIDGEEKRVREYYNAMRSAWYEKRLASAGLGSEYHIDEVQDAVAASKYLAKYLFKDVFQTVWPPGWKRIRYSQNWPKLERQKNESAWPILVDEDWRRLSYEAGNTITIEQCDEPTRAHIVGMLESFTSRKVIRNEKSVSLG